MSCLLFSFDITFLKHFLNFLSRKAYFRDYPLLLLKYLLPMSSFGKHFKGFARKIKINPFFTKGRELKNWR